MDKFQYRPDAETNRGYDTKYVGGKNTIPAVTIMDVDAAILYKLQKGFGLSVNEDGKSIAVPVMMADGEKWVQVRKNKLLRSHDGQVIIPLMILHRSSMSADTSFSKLEIPNSQRIAYLSPRNNADAFNNLRETYNTNESTELAVSVIPDYVNIQYELVIWTHYQTQLNYIVEQILTENNVAWGDVYQFVTKVGDWSFELLNEPSGDRVVKGKTQLSVKGILHSEYELLEKTTNSAFSIKRVAFNTEIVDTGQEFTSGPDKIYTKRKI